MVLGVSLLWVSWVSMIALASYDGMDLFILLLSLGACCFFFPVPFATSGCFSLSLVRGLMFVSSGAACMWVVWEGDMACQACWLLLLACFCWFFFSVTVSLEFVAL